ncbi:putative sodium-dependent multivitamin transporter [Ixodes scapularis]
MAVYGFMAADYIVLIGFLALSTSIGVFFAWSDRRQQSNKTFLTANKQLGWVPVSLSMMASFLSSIAILGLPSEVFVHGSSLWMGAVSSTIAVILAAYVFLPMYYKMDITSINEYLERRFNSTAVRNVASGVFIVQTLLYMGVVLYGPSLALGSGQCVTQYKKTR